jgi:putative flippase GtrA
MSSSIIVGSDDLTTSSPHAPTRSGIARLVPAEMVKYAIVGFSGIGVNLVTMAAILHQTALRDWRASLVASLVSTMNNYVWNNFWTFGSRAHSGLTFIRRSFIYLAVSLGGLVVTTVTYALSSRALGDVLQQREPIAQLPVSHLNAASSGALATPVSALLLCQLAAIIIGTLCNYVLNRTFTWPEPPKH